MAAAAVAHGRGKTTAKTDADLIGPRQAADPDNFPIEMNNVTIAAQVAEMHSAEAPRNPDAAESAFARDLSGLAAAGVPAGVLSPGTRLPDADLIAADGSRVTLHGVTVQEKHSLVYSVLSDPGNTVARALGVLTAPGLDLTQVNADGTAGLPMPTTVVVDDQGVIRWIDVHPDYTPGAAAAPADVRAAAAPSVGGAG